MYRIRGRVQELAGKQLTTANYEQITKQYEETGGELPGVYREPRGFLIEPHTQKIVPLGTREVDQYDAPKYLYNKLIFIEKRSYAPIIRQSGLPEKYDIAFVCSEGYAVRACRRLMRDVQEKASVRIACVHDADPAGYLIYHKLARANARSNFDLDIIDFGLSIADAMEMGLEHEEFVRLNALQKDLLPTLTELESGYFTGKPEPTWKHGRQKRIWTGCRRIELNAMLPPSVYQYVRRVNQDGWQHANLIRLLQKAESSLVIESVCGDLLQRYRRSFFIPLHDAVYTIEPDVSKVVSAFERVFREIGFHMRLSVEA